MSLRIHQLGFVFGEPSVGILVKSHHVKITAPFAASTTLQFFDRLFALESVYWHVLGTQYCAPMTTADVPMFAERLAIV
jgi:hypothetical protein